jgi:hypothetical protein
MRYQPRPLPAASPPLVAPHASDGACGRHERGCNHTSAQRTAAARHAARTRARRRWFCHSRFRRPLSDTNRLARCPPPPHARKKYRRRLRSPRHARNEQQHNTMASSAAPRGVLSPANFAPSNEARTPLPLCEQPPPLPLLVAHTSRAR